MTNIDPSIAQRQADFIEELEEKLAELKNQPVPDPSSASGFSEQEPQMRLNVNIPQSMHRQFKAITSARGESITDVVTALIGSYLREHGGR